MRWSNWASVKRAGAVYMAPIRRNLVDSSLPPKGQEKEAMPPNAKYGLAGSIATQDACETAGGTFKPRIFGWMVHIYPGEKTSDAIWSVERQAPEKMAVH